MLAEYYRNSHVRARLLEFLGGDSLADATSVFMTASGSGQPAWHEPKTVQNIVQFLGDGIEVGRSLWDRKSLIADIDVEYVNFDVPSESYLEPIRTFRVQQPVIQAIQETLVSFGIVPLHILSGRGHHFVWRIRRDSPAFAVLAWIGHVPDTLAGRYAQPQLPAGEIVAPELGAAYAGLGLVMEFIAHRILEISGGRCEIPVELTAVEAGPRSHGREVISIDLSEYGDPLHTRTLRMPFSAYLKPQPLLPYLFTIPLQEMNLFHGLLVMRDVGAVKELAHFSSVAIPDHSSGTEKMISAYRQSRLASFHRDFYTTKHDRPEIWPETYDRVPLQDLPPCVARILQEPNDLLLKPAGIQHVVRMLMARGWRPRHIAGLIRSKYERDFGWGNYWFLYDAANRADFYVRVFAGLFFAGRDDLIDFNCRSTQEKGYCGTAPCDRNLEGDRRRLLGWRRRDATLEPAQTGQRDSIE